jgi:hypothetical protein
LLVAVYFLPSFLVVAIGKGQLQNRHPKARQSVILLPATAFSQFSKFSTLQFSSFFLLSSTGSLNLWAKKSEIGYCSLPKDIL